MTDTPTHTTKRACCIECGREWLDPRERFRAEDTADAEGVVFYCADCWSREFEEADDA